MNLIHRGRVARFATVPQNPSTLRSPFPRGEGFFAFPKGAGGVGASPSGEGDRSEAARCAASRKRWWGCKALSLLW